MPHRALDELEAGLAHVAAAPRDDGTVRVGDTITRVEVPADLVG